MRRRTFWGGGGYGGFRRVRIGLIKNNGLVYVLHPLVLMGCITYLGFTVYFCNRRILFSFTDHREVHAYSLRRVIAVRAVGYLFTLTMIPCMPATLATGRMVECTKMVKV